MKKNFADTLKSIMDEKGVRPVDIVRKTTISKGTLSKILNNTRKPRYDTLIQLADYLDESMDRLCGRQ